MKNNKSLVVVKNNNNKKVVVKNYSNNKRGVVKNNNNNRQKNYNNKWKNNNNNIKNYLNLVQVNFLGIHKFHTLKNIKNLYHMNISIQFIEMIIMNNNIFH